MLRRRWREGVLALLCLALTAGALLLLAGPLRSVGVAVTGHALPWWALAPVFTLTELVVVNVQLRRESVSISFAEVPLVLGLAFCSPQGYVLAGVVGPALALLYHRQRGLKLAVNLAMFAFESALNQLLYHAVVSGGDPLGLRGFLATILTIAATQAVSTGTLIVVIWVSTGRYADGLLREAMTSALVAALANSSVGLLVVLLAVTRPSALILLGVVVGALALAYRGYSTLRHGHARLESLYRFTDRLGGAVRTDDVVQAVLNEARDVLTAESAEVVLLETDLQPRVHLRLDDGGLAEVAPRPADDWWRPALAGEPVLRRRGAAGPGPRDGIAVPLKVDDRTVGLLAVTCRPYHRETFGGNDRRLFASLANHASLSLHKAHLLDRLAAEAAAQEHQSLHDSLTGLPNRRRFLQVVEEALRTDPRVTVLMLDLDEFKDVNDAFGHGTGDLLLMEMGSQLCDRVDADSVARLGNDEFAVLLRGTADGRRSARRARELVSALATPFSVGEVDLEVRVSAGMAWSPAHGTDAETLLQHADTALYLAKQRRSDVEVYRPAMDGASTRLLMTGHLRDSLLAGDLEVHFQPKIDPATDRATGAEALVRWRHPAHGQVSPEAFIPLAERTGLIRPLTRVVLGSALRSCAAWRSDGYDLGVAVNLSARSLTDPDLPGLVRQELEQAGLAAEALTLEITETAVMEDLHRSLGVLQELRAVGVHLSVDDFGTGQSSLAYLKQLPIDEMKIDKGFVLDLADRPEDSAIVRAAIDLGHALGLKVVAEGVEDSTTQALLAGWGCDVAQGFHISRPLPLPEFRRWLTSRREAGIGQRAVGVAGS